MRPLISLVSLALLLALVAACGGAAQAPAATQPSTAPTGADSTLPSLNSGSTTMPAADTGSAAMPAPDTGSAAMPAPDTGSAAMPAPDTGSTTMPAVDTGSTTMPAVDTGSTTMPAVDTGSTTMPASNGGAVIMAGPTGDLVLALHELNVSGQQGIVVFTTKGATTEVSVIGNAGISTANHIHSGSCAVLGGVVHPLTSLVDGKGVTTVNAALDSLATGDFAVNLHKTGDPATYTACADIPAKGSFVTVQLNEMNASGQSGIASLMAKGAATEAVLYATAGISVANHIHSGSCAVLGGVVHALTPMSEGVSITTVNATFASLTKGGLAINLHKATDPAVYTACGDIPALSAGAASGAAATSPKAFRAEVRNYVLPSLKVNVGTTVNWAQRDVEGHTVTSPGLFDSGILDEGKSFSYTFTKELSWNKYSICGILEG